LRSIGRALVRLQVERELDEGFNEPTGQMNYLLRFTIKGGLVSDKLLSAK
jgi:hypothetical protein